MVESKLVDNLIDELKDKYWCETKLTNNSYNDLIISPKSNLFNKSANFTLSLHFSDFGDMDLNINTSNFHFETAKDNRDLSELHNLVKSLMKIEKLISDQQEIDNARKDTNNARKENKN